MTVHNYNEDKFDSNPDPDVDESAERPVPHDVYATGLTGDGAQENTFLAPPLSAHKDESGETVINPHEDAASEQTSYPSHDDNVFVTDEHVLDDTEGGAHEGNQSSHDDKTFHPVPESLGEHREGESLKEWLANDLEQTKKDLHIGHDK